MKIENALIFQTCRRCEPRCLPYSYRRYYSTSSYEVPGKSGNTSSGRQSIPENKRENYIGKLVALPTVCSPTSKIIKTNLLKA